MPTATLRYRRHLMRDFPPDTVKHDVSIGDWLHMVLGDVPGPRNVLSGMMHGIYGGDIDKLGLRSVLPAFWYGMHMRRGYEEELIPRQDYELLKELDPRKRGMEGDVREWSVAEVMSFPEGMDTLVEAMRGVLDQCPNVTVKAEAPVTGLRYREVQDKVEVRHSSRPANFIQTLTFTSSPLRPNLLPSTTKSSRQPPAQSFPPSYPISPSLPPPSPL